MRLFLLLITLCTALIACSTMEPLPTLAPKPPTRVVDTFQDDFSKDVGVWQTFDEAKAAAAIANGYLNITVKEPFTVSLSIAALNLNDFDLSVITKQTSVGTANGYGVIFRYIDDKNFYRFDIGGDSKWAVSRRMREQWIHLSELKSSAAIQPSPSTNTIRIVARGDSFEFYANGSLLGKLNDSNLAIGRIGLFASTFDDPKTQVIFDDVKVVKP
jgi:hypothetical protein